MMSSYYLLYSEDVVNEDTTKFTSQLKNFIDDKKESVLIFPSSLSSNQRRIIHEVKNTVESLYSYSLK